jgi:hypothetical protein
MGKQNDSPRRQEDHEARQKQLLTAKMPGKAFLDDLKPCFLGAMVSWWLIVFFCISSWSSYLRGESFRL